MIKRSILITALTVSNSFFGFLVQLIMAKKFGASEYLDYYFYALSYPVFISATLASVYGYALVPKIASSDHEDRKKTISSMFWFLIALIVVCVCFSPLFVEWMFIGLSLVQGEKGLSVLFFVAVFIGVLQSLQGLFSSVLNATGQQIRAVFMLSFPYVGMLIFVLFFSSYGVSSIAFGMLFGIVFSLIFGWFWISGYIKAYLDLSSVLEFFKHGVLVALALTCFSSYSVIDAYWATKAGDGVLTIMNYSQRILIAVGNLVVAAISVLIVPKFSKAISDLDLDFLSHGFFRILSVFLCLNGFVWICFYFISALTINILFVGGEFDSDQAQILDQAIKNMLIGVFFMLSSVVLFRLLYCFVGVEKVAAFIGLFWSLLYFTIGGIYFVDGAEGLAISYSISWVVVFTMLFSYFLIVYRKKLNGK